MTPRFARGKLLRAMPFATIQEAAELYRRGSFVIIVDDEDRENEGDLCIAAEKITPETVNFMAKYGRGLICLALTEEKTAQDEELAKDPPPAESSK